jgi:MFS family permease
MKAGFAMLVAITALSQFHRTCLGVIAPELSADLALSPQALGWANGAFFLALALLQIPVGMLFDRIGARRTIVGLTAISVVAAAWQALAASAGEFIAARLLLGVGCAASFMGTVTLCAWWYPRAQLATRISQVFALSQIGTLAAATPLALAAGAIGWRWSFGAVAAASALLGFLFHWLVRDRLDGGAMPSKQESFGEVWRGLLTVWRTPGLWQVLAMHCFAYAGMATVLGLWAGPYLADTYGLDGAARGNVMLAMAIAQFFGILAFGPLDRVFNTRKWIIVPGALGTIGLLLALALVPKPPLALAATLLVLVCLVTSYSVVIVAHGRSLFPDHLVGRGVTTVNLAQVVGLTILPVVTGAIVNAFPPGAAGRPEEAYRAAFGAIGLALAMGLAVYFNAKDAKPSGQR